MIFYKNKKTHKKTSEKNLVFSIFEDGIVSNVDDSIAKPTACKNFYNLSYVDGALKNGMGFSELSVPASIDNLQDCHTFKIAAKMQKIEDVFSVRLFNPSTQKYEYTLYLMDENFKLWKAPLIDQFEGAVWTATNKLSSAPTFQCAYRFDNDDTVLFFSKEGMLRKSYTAEVLYSNVPPIISCVVHYDNFFGITNTNRNTLIYTNNLNLTVWEESQKSAIEFLDNRGSFNKLVAFNDYVYLFREYGITKISIYSAKADFSFTHLFTSTSKIYEDSVCVCGEKVFFATREGLFTFNGNSVDKVAENCDVFFAKCDNTNCASACLNGKYYFATRCNFADGQTIGCEQEAFVNNVLFSVDINTLNLQVLRGVDIKKLLVLDNPYFCKLCAIFNGENKQKVGQLECSGKTFLQSNQKMWQSFFTDMGFSGKRKRVKEILLTTLFPISVEIKSDEETKTFQFSGDEKQQKMQICVHGSQFQFTFFTNELNCDVKKPVIVFDVA